MAPLPTATSTALRACARQRLPAASLAAIQCRRKADAARPGAAFDSPFEQPHHDTNKIPDFSRYMSRRGETSNRVFQYFMAGAMGAITAAGAKATVNGTSVDTLGPGWGNRPRWRGWR